MTITQLRKQVTAMPVSVNHFGVIDRLVSWIDWELLPDGADREAPCLIWDDDGTVLICEGETCRLVIGARREGKWFAMAPREHVAASRAMGAAIEALTESSAVAE
jgi:hypothetical protein